MSVRVLALIATIPARRASLERLLRELPEQSRVPDGVILCLDGYTYEEMEKLSIPASLAPVVWTVLQSGAPSGPGCRWRRAHHLVEEKGRQRGLDPEALLVSLDDDAELGEAPRFIDALVRAVEEHGGAAAAMGYTKDGHRAAPGPMSRGRLILGCGCGLAVRAGHLEGLLALADQVKVAGGPDALGPLGDDQALLSAHLYLRGVPLFHAATGPLSFADGTQRESQWMLRKAEGARSEHEQAHAIAEITARLHGPHRGWPFPSEAEILRHVEVQEQPALSWEGELSAVPPGAIRAKGAAPPTGYVRKLVVDEEEPERSGVYDVPL